MRRLALALVLAAALSPFACVYDWTVEPDEAGGGSTSAPSSPSSSSSSPMSSSTRATGAGTGGAPAGGPSSSTGNTSTGPSSTTGSGGGGGVGNDLGGGGGSTTASTGSFGTTACPDDAHLPDAGTACGRIGVICEYSAKGDKNDPRPSCRDDFECDDAGVLSPTQTADAGACDMLPDCPAGNSCTGSEQCRTGNSIICYCINGTYSCSDTQGAGGGCPTDYPNQGQPCTYSQPTTCHYGLCGRSDYVIRTCTGDIWVGGSPSGGCDAGSQQN